jgi:hypothetical protein
MVDLSLTVQALAAVAALLKVYEFYEARYLKKVSITVR